MRQYYKKNFTSKNTKNHKKFKTKRKLNCLFKKILFARFFDFFVFFVANASFILTDEK